MATFGIGTTKRPPHSRMNCNLLHDFIFQVPGQDDDIVRLCLPDSVRMINRDMSARQEPPLFVGASIHCVFDEILADAAVVQQRRALARRSISGHRLALARRLDQELHQRQLGLFHLAGETFVTFHRSQPGASSSPSHFLDARLDRVRLISLCGRRKTRSEPPCVANSSTSNTFSP